MGRNRAILILSLAMALTAWGIARGDGTIDLVPETVGGFIRIGSVEELNNKLNDIAATMNPTGEGPETDVLAEMLKGTFGGKYGGIGDLQRMGFNTKGDLTIVFADSTMKNVYVMFGVASKAKLQDALSQILKSPGSATYSGVEYFSAGGGEESYAIVGDTFIFSSNVDLLKKAIDSAKSNPKSILKNDLFRSLGVNLEDDIAVYLAVESILSNYSEVFQRFMNEVRESNQMLRPIGVIETNMIDQTKALGITLAIDYDQVRIDISSKMKEGTAAERESEIDPLDEFQSLPGYHVVGVGRIDSTKPIYQSEEFIKEILDAVGNDFAFAMNMDSFPKLNSLMVFSVKDEDKVMELMRDLPDKITESGGIAPGISPFGAVKSVSEGEPVTLGDIEFKSIRLELAGPIKIDNEEMTELGLWYALHDGKLICSGPINPKPAEDYQKALMGENTAVAVQGFYDMSDMAPDSLETAVMISPMGLAKAIFKEMAKKEQGMGMMYMMIQNIPNRYGLGVFSSALDKSRVKRHRVLLSLSDFGPVFAMMFMK